MYSDIIFLGADRKIIDRVRAVNNYSVHQLLFINSTQYVVEEVHVGANNNVIVNVRRAI